MDRSNYLYLVFFIGFIVITVLTFINGINDSVVFLYTIAALAFSIIEVLNKFLNHKARIEELEEDESKLDTSFYKEYVENDKDKAIDTLRNSNDVTSAAKTELMKRLGEKKDLFEATKLVFGDHTENLLKDRKSRIEEGMEMFDWINDLVEQSEPSQSKRSFFSVTILMIVAVLIIFVAPFIPEYYVIQVFGDNYSSLTIPGTLLTLSIIFLSYYIDLVLDSRAMKVRDRIYKNMKKDLQGVHMMMKEYGSEIGAQSEIFSSNINDVLALSAMNIINSAKDYESEIDKLRKKRGRK